MKLRRCVGWRLAALLLLVAALSPALEGREELEAIVVSAVQQPRSRSPIYLDVEFESSAAHLIEGHLEIVFRDGLEIVGMYQSGPLVLTTGVQSFKIMVPAMTLSGYRLWAEARVQFVTEKGRYNLGEHSIFMPVVGKRSLVVCLAAARTGFEPDHADTARSLLLGQFDPTGTAPGKRTFASSVAVVDPEALPVRPLGWCMYDIVVVPGAAFNQMRQRQLGALLRWVRAGGSLCVIPLARGMKPYHVDFLNDLAGGGEDASFRGVGAELATGEDSPQDRVVMLRHGVGRAVIVTNHPRSVDLVAMRQWREAAAFLWKVRSGHVASLVDGGKWPVDLGGLPRQSVPGYWEDFSVAEEGVDFRPQLVASSRQLLDSLMPTSLQVIPVGIMVAMLVLFLLAVGPFDYYVLGVLKCRRFTWVLFPATCVGFALFTVWLSNRYMGMSHRTGSVLFIDVGREGTVLRQSRYQMLFAPKARDLTTRVQGALFVQIGQRSLGSRGLYVLEEPTRFEGGQAPRYSGWMPTDYTVRQRLRQWTPMLCRALSLAAAPPADDLNWDAVGPADFKSAQARGGAVAKLLAGRQFDGSLICFHGTNMFVMRSGDSVNKLASEARSRDLPPSAQRRRTGSSLDSSFLKVACVRPHLGMFALVSQVSPTGGPDFEDLSVLDPTDGGQWLLVAVSGSGTDYVVQRRLYREGS